MPDVAPFKGIRYRTAAPSDLGPVSSPPYDVISASERAELEDASPHNVVRLILGPLDASDSPYGASRALLDEWLAAGVVAADAEPGLYVYEETFVAAGRRRRQVGVLAAVEISDEILPHERTMGRVVEDRLAVVRATEANLSPVVCLYWASDDVAASAIAATMAGEPYADFVSADGIGHRAWRMTEQAAVEAVAKTLASARVVIADGHHRYRTAEAYRDERRTAGDGAGPWDRMLLYLIDAERDAPAVLPIHRLVSGLDPHDAIERLAAAFDVEQADPSDPDLLAADVASVRAGVRCYAMLARGEAWLLTLRDEAVAAAATEGEHCDAWRDLDVAVLHSLVFEQLLGSPEVTYVHHPHEAAEAVASGDASFAVLLAPTPVEAVRAVAEARDSMPPKSTFFVPKPRTGIVIRSLRPGAQP